MKRIIVLVIALWLARGLSAQNPRPATLEYFGQSCFLLTTSSGLRIIMDPPALKYPLPTEEADVVTVSHEHFDHNNIAAIKGKPVVLRGLRRDGSWNNVDQTIKGVHIYNFGTYHDNKEGAAFGKNSIFVYEFDKIKLVHLGDLGHVLDEKTVKKIGRPDFMLVPVGGQFTIDADKAWQVVGQLSPRVIIPMHYQTVRTMEIAIVPVDSFLKGRKNVRQLGSTRTDLTAPPQQEVWVFKTP